MAENDPTPSPAPAPAPASTPWYDGVNPELVGHLQAHGWDKKTEKEVAIAAAQSHFAAQKLIGVSEHELLRIPKPEDQAGWEKVYERLGAPKEYKFEGLKFEDGTEPEKEFTDFLAATAKKMHLTQNAAQDFAQTMMKQMGDAEKTELAEQTASIQKEREALQKDWGQDWEAHRFIAERGALALGFTKEEVATLQNVVGYKAVMERFHAAGIKMGEARFVRSGGPDGKALMTRSTAANRRAELMADKAWVARYTTGGKTELDEMMAINTILSAPAQQAA